MDKEAKTAIVARLRELAAGAEPADERAGICFDLRCHQLIGSEYEEIAEVFEKMNLSRTWPIGRDRGFKKWSGPRGKKRRAFAGEVANFIEENY